MTQKIWTTVNLVTRECCVHFQPVDANGNPMGSESLTFCMNNHVLPYNGRPYIFLIENNVCCIYQAVQGPMPDGSQGWLKTGPIVCDNNPRLM